MMQQHPRPRVSHDLPNLLAPSGYVAVDGALGAGRFRSPEWALAESQVCVGKQLAAFGTEPFPGCSMMGMAGDPDHRRHGPSFSRQPLIFGQLFHLWLERDDVAGLDRRQRG